MSDEVIQHMRGRAAQCRRLAALISDEFATQSLLNMATQIEADIRKLEAGREDRPKPEAT